MKSSKRMLPSYGWVLIMVGAQLLFSCDKGNSEPATDTALLTDKRWRLVRVTYNEKGVDVEDAIPLCRQDDELEFESNRIFVRYNGPSRCAQEPDQEEGSWKLQENPKRITFEEVDYQIVALTATNLNVQRNLRGADGDVVINEYFVAR